MSFRNSCRDRGWIMPPGDSRAPTHFLMDGGKICVPDTDASSFLNIFYKHLLKGEKIALVERRTPHFKLFFDVDCTFSKNTAKSERDYILEHISERIRQCAEDFFVFENECTDPILCTTTAKRVDDDSEKMGAHLVFPSIFVNSVISLKFRDFVLERLENDDEMKSKPMNDWTDVIDAAVYNANGLRIIYATKGKDDDRIYRPLKTIGINSIDSIVIDKPSKQRELIHECSIRLFTGNLTPTVGGYEHEADSDENHRVAGKLSSGKRVSLSIYSDVLPEIRKILPKEYSDATFTGAFEADQMVWLKLNSHFCPNLRRDHRTSTVFLELTRKGMCVRCYCRKGDYGCPKFKSPVIKIPNHVADILFPSASMQFIEDTETVVALKKRTSKNGKNGELATLLVRNPMLRATKKSKKSRKKKEKNFSL